MYLFPVCKRCCLWVIQIRGVKVIGIDGFAYLQLCKRCSNRYYLVFLIEKPIGHIWAMKRMTTSQNVLSLWLRRVRVWGASLEKWENSQEFDDITAFKTCCKSTYTTGGLLMSTSQMGKWWSRGCTCVAASWHADANTNCGLNPTLVGLEVWCNGKEYQYLSRAGESSSAGTQGVNGRLQRRGFTKTGFEWWIEPWSNPEETIQIWYEDANVEASRQHGFIQDTKRR